MNIQRRYANRKGVWPYLVVVGDDMLQFLQLVDDRGDLREPVEGQDEVSDLHTEGQLRWQAPQLVVPGEGER